MPETPDSSKPTVKSNWLQIMELLRPHWKTLSLALVAVIGVTITDLLEPWPLKIILDNLLQSKPLPHWLAGMVRAIAGDNKYSVLNFAIFAVAAIAVVGAISSYMEKYLTTSVGQWVMHDLRRTLYEHIHGLSLAEHDEKRTGDLVPNLFEPGLVYPRSRYVTSEAINRKQRQSKKDAPPELRHLEHVLDG